MVLEFESIHAGPRLLERLLRDPFGAFHRAQDGRATAIELFEFLAAALDTPHVDLGHRTCACTSEATDEWSGQACVEHLEHGLHGGHFGGELLCEGLQDGLGSHA